MRGWPLPRPTHAPATTLKTNGNSAPTKLKKQNAHQYSSRLSSGCERISQTKKIKTLMQPLPRRHAWLASPPANTCSRNRPQNKRQQHPNHPPKPKTPRAVTLWRHACLTTPERVKESPNPPNPSCSRSRGGMRGWPVHRPTHAPATTLKTNGNSAPIKPMSFPSSAWECVPRSSASHSCSRNNPQNKKQKPTPLVPSLLRWHGAA